MSIYDQLLKLQFEFEKTCHSDSPSFFCFVEYCGNIRSATDFFFENTDSEKFLENENGPEIVFKIRRAAHKKMAEQKLIAKASELPISKAWTANGIDETKLRIKNLEEAANSKTQSLIKIENMILTGVTIADYKKLQKIIVDSLRQWILNPNLSIGSIMPLKYRLFIGNDDIEALDMILKLILEEIDEKSIQEIENMTYLDFKYTLLLLVFAARLTYDFPPNYEFYRFCSTLPKNPNENSELIQKSNDLIQLTNSKMKNSIKLAKTYEKYEQYETKILTGK